MYKFTDTEMYIYLIYVNNQVTLSDEEFSGTWTQISTILSRLAADTCSALIKHIQRDVLDRDTQKFYIQALTSSLHEERKLSHLGKTGRVMAAPTR